MQVLCNCRFILAIGILLAPAFCQNITEIHTLTNTIDNADMDGDGEIRVYLINRNFESCETPGLNEVGNTYLRGATDVFRDNEIGTCLGFHIPEKIVPILEVRHFGGDGLNLVWVRLMLDDMTYLNCDGCTNDGWVDDTANIQCSCQ